MKDPYPEVKLGNTNRINDLQRGARRRRMRQVERGPEAMEVVYPIVPVVQEDLWFALKYTYDCDQFLYGDPRAFLKHDSIRGLLNKVVLDP